MRIGSKRYYKIVAICLLLIQLFELVSPMAAYALTSGPTAPEVQSFEPAGTTDMVDLFTGDFNYNIPLFELPGPNGGYPFNLAYHAGIGMDQEATWTGLGWNLNPGAINRDVRGLVDDFNGDEIKITEDMRKNWTVGVGIGFKWEPVGFNVNVGVGASTTIYYNSYRGIGYKIGSEVSLKAQASNGMNASFGLNMSLDNQEGVGINPSVGLGRSTGSSSDDAKYNGMTLGIGYNSKRGLTDLSLGYTRNTTKTFGKTFGKNGKSQHMGSMSATISFSNTAFTPRISSPMVGYGLDFSASFGVEMKANHFAGNLQGYYNEEDLKYKNKPRYVKAYGYINQQNASDDDMVDINREKEGLITPNLPNLAIPQMTYDVYTIQGQGVGGDFRPFRSDIGSTYDNRVVSEYGNGASGFGIGVGIPSTGIPDFKYEIDLSINYANTQSGKWSEGSFDFISGNEFDKTFEPSYFRVNGEPTTETADAMDYIGGDATVRINLGGTLNSPSMNGFLRKDNTNFTSNNKRKVINGSSRKPKNTTISHFTNEEVNNTSLYPEYKAQYYDKVDVSPITESSYSSSSLSDYTRPVNNSMGKHIGAYTVLDANGSKYNYALPVYNYVNIDNIYSVTNEDADAIGTKLVNTFTNAGSFDEYLKKTELPPYTTSHMLTSILGQDYVDLANDGPSDDDFGYWVKFTYSKVSSQTSPYKWRAPFTGANYMTDTRTKQKDNKASYLYGEKDMYYLATAETKSHIAVFEVERRDDGRGANSETQTYPAIGAALGAYSYKLTKIKLYSKAVYGTVGAKPLMTVHFEYYPSSMELCQNVENRSGSGGKLTLKHVWFTYENSSRGETNKYEFKYVAKNTVNDAPYNYNRLNQDRWGNYKEYSATNTDDVDFPYVDQDPSSTAKTKRDNDISAWSLAEINTPTGSKIKINYESDDYGYVQNRVAGQMFKVTRFHKDLQANRIYNSFSIDWNDDAENRKVYFQLEKPITAGNSTIAANKVRELYLSDLKNPEGIEQLYFRILVDMKKHGDGEGRMKEYVSGYAEIESAGVLDTDNNPSNSGTFTEGWIRLKPVKLGSRTLQGHPFSIAAWTYLRTNLPDVYSLVGQLNAPAGTAEGEKIATAKSIWNAFGSLTELFSDFYRRSFKREFAQYVDDDGANNVENCVIRLNTPDKCKYGGGHRVKSIIISDDWKNSTADTDKSSEYGVVYEYGYKDGDNVVSYGVAQYEPILGGDEIALRYSRNYSESVPLKSANNLYFEYPVNEAYFPAAVVGYSKVVVRSLATDRQIRTVTDGLTTSDNDYVPNSAATTGESVHEFYTAREFPIITDMTTHHSEKVINNPGSDASKVREKFFIPVIGIGSISVDNMSASQGYKIELNDMHGKQKQVTYYGMTKDGLVDRTAPISYVRYNYLCNSNYSSDIYRPLHNKLTSTVNVLTADGVSVSREMGVDYDLFTDARETKTYSATGGFNLNTDALAIYLMVIPIIMPWPAISYTENFVRTNVANKIIHRTGIISSVEAFDGESKVVTNNLCFDAVSGKPLLTTVNNNFDAPIYSYSMPAHWPYEEIGAAYRNIGLTTEINEFSDQPVLITDISGTSGQYIYVLSDNSGIDFVEKHLVEGDKVLLWEQSTSGLPANLAIARVVLKNKEQASIVLEKWVGATPSIGIYSNAKIIESGRKNLITVDAASYKTTANPLGVRPVKQCTVEPNSSSLEANIATIEIGLNKILQLINAYFALHGSTSPFTINNTDPLWEEYMDGISSSVASISWNPSNYFFSINMNGYSCPMILEYGSAAPIGVDPLEDTTTIGYRTSGVVPQPCYPVTSINEPVSSIGVWNVNNSYFEASTYVNGNTSCPAKILFYRDCAALIPAPACEIYQYQIIKDVISASAQKYNDRWHHTFNDVQNEALRTNLRNYGEYNPYRTGEAGIWRTEESYVYVDDRERKVPVQIKTDGTFDDVPIFQWKTPFFVDFPCDNVAKWRKTNTVTMYDMNSNENENKNILDIYSSALFGYKGQLATTVASNAKQNEIGFESFEEYSTVAGANEFNNATGNFDFVTSYINGSYQRYYDYKVLLGTGYTFELDLPYSEVSQFTTGQLVKIIAESPEDNVNDDEYWRFIIKNCVITGLEESSCETDNCNIKVTIGDGANTLWFKYLSKLADRCWRGRMIIEKDVPASVQSLSAVYSTDKAHTGKQSYKVSGNTIIPQLGFELQENKKYVFDMWVSKMDINTHKYLGDYVTIKCYDKNDNLLSTETASTIGEVIEGWQKVEKIFITPAGIHHFSIGLAGAAGDNVVYYDDIRIFPFDGNMKCFVYDPSNYKLRATLNENNYSTRYYYNEKGELFLTKVETNNGVETIQEVKSHTKPN